MKSLKYYYLLLFFFLLNKQTNAQFVTIPDPVFAAWLNTSGYCMNGNTMDTQCPAILNATSLYVSTGGISDFTGIQYFINVTTLRISGILNPFFGPFPPNIETLDVRFNNNITSLPNLPATLKILGCSFNLLTALPPLPPGLEELYCENNLLSTLPVLPSTLRGLNCEANNLIALPPLVNTQVEYLYCNNNNIATIPSLPQYLIILYAQHNQLTTLPKIPTSTQTLLLDHNLLDSLPSMDSTLMADLRCSYNNLKKLPLLPNSINAIDIKYNQFDTIIALPYTQLHQFSCGHNSLTSIPTLYNCSYRFECSYNKLTSLPTLVRIPLTLICDHNQLTSIPLKGTVNYLDFRSNPVTCMPDIRRVMLSLNWDSTGIQCMPGYIYQDIGASIYPLPSTVPYCDSINPFNCPLRDNISGRIYIDSLTNCLIDSAETKIKNVKVNLYSNSVLTQQTFSRNNGQYAFSTNYGTYEYTVDTSFIPVMVNCPASISYNSVLDSVNKYYFDKDFSIECKPDFDVGVNSVFRDSGSFRPGGFARLKIFAGDLSNQFHLNCAAGISGEIKVVISGPGSYVAPVNGALIPVISNDTLIYIISDYGQIDLNKDFGIILLIDSAAQLNDQVCLNISASPDSGDNNSSNNNNSHCFNVVNSYDPNLKEVNKSSIKNNSSEWLTYTIYYQNTGNAPARDIVINDKLDAGLDAGTLQILNSSHDPQIHLYGSQLEFIFPGIYLFDSTSNEPGSHGYIQFKIKTKPLLAGGYQIKNSVSIFFDYNPPVITNTAITTVQCPTGINNYSFTLCAGDSIQLGSTFIKSSGLYIDTLTSRYGCDSVVSLQLIVTNPLFSIVDTTICIYETFDFNGSSISNSGTYIDTLSGSNSCDSIITLHLSVDSIPVSLHVSNDSLLITGTGSYTWFNCANSTIINGQQNSYYIPTASGDYAAIISNGNCSDTTLCISVIISDVEKKVYLDSYNLSPNPAADQIEIKGLLKAGNSINIYDITGKKILSCELKEPTSSFILDVITLPNGVYFIQILTETGNLRLRFVKQQK
ncbi:MAG: T9SS type A sorting domain-containing protein [Bacteroidota bacterium]